MIKNKKIVIVGHNYDRQHGRVNNNTRAAKGGKAIFCPSCDKPNVVYHFSFSAGTCQFCDKMIDKGDWLLENKNGQKLNQEEAKEYYHKNWLSYSERQEKWDLVKRETAMTFVDDAEEARHRSFIEGHGDYWGEDK